MTKECIWYDYYYFWLRAIEVSFEISYLHHETMGSSSKRTGKGKEEYNKGFVLWHVVNESTKAYLSTATDPSADNGLKHHTEIKNSIWLQ